MNNNETKDVWVLRKLREVQKYQEVLGSQNGNICRMAKDSADVIEDLQRETQDLRTTLFEVQQELFKEAISHREDLNIMGSGPIPEGRVNVFEEQRKNVFMGLTADEVHEVILDCKREIGPDEEPK